MKNDDILLVLADLILTNEVDTEPKFDRIVINSHSSRRTQRAPLKRHCRNEWLSTPKMAWQDSERRKWIEEKRLPSTQGTSPVCPFHLQAVDLHLKRLCFLASLLNRVSKLAAIALPTCNGLEQPLHASSFGLDLFTDLAQVRPSG